MCVKNVLFESFIFSRLHFVVDAQLKSVMKDSQLLLNYLHSRHSPAEIGEIKNKKEKYKEELLKQCAYQTPNNNVFDFIH